MQTLTLFKEKGHPILEIDGKRALIDTGAPITFGECPIEFLGKKYDIQKDFFSITSEKASELAGIKFDITLGNDILSKQNIRFRWKDGFVDFGDDVPEGEIVLNYEDFMGSIIFPFKIGSIETKVILDTGAFLSYIYEDLVNVDEKVREEEDFHPLVGRYVTNVYKKQVKLNGIVFVHEFGVLPKTLALMTKMIFSATGAKAIIGTKLFEQFDCTINWQKQKISFNPKE